MKKVFAKWKLFSFSPKRFDLNCTARIDTTTYIIRTALNIVFEENGLFSVKFIDIMRLHILLQMKIESVVLKIENALN